MLLLMCMSLCVCFCLSSLCNETPEVSEGQGGKDGGRNRRCLHCCVPVQIIRLLRSVNLQPARGMNSALFTKERGVVLVVGQHVQPLCAREAKKPSDC